MSMKIIEADEVDRVLNFPDLVEAIRTAFGSTAGTPRRIVFRLDDVGSGNDAFAVLPAWNAEVIGVKAFTYLPGNAAKGRAILHSKILLFDRESGAPFAVVDGTSVTYWRTAAVAAVAADYLARRDASRLLVCGTGKLAPFMALAHASVRPIRTVRVWGRDGDKAALTVETLRARRPDLSYRVVDSLEPAVREADVISCATGAHEPIIFGDWVQPGTHTDFCGNHERSGRECDSTLIEKSCAYVDSRANVLNEAGEFLIPIGEKRITADHIKGELAELCSGAARGRDSDADITLFKSVGTALSDLAAAQLVTQRQ
jgi:1-pyrroline-2-carboxylate reductase [NAD(P)H]